LGRPQVTEVAVVGADLGGGAGIVAAKAKQRAEQEQAFAAAKSADTIGAVDEFLNNYPESGYTDEARTLHADLMARDEACKAAMASDDAAVLKAFLKAYPTGSAAERVRSRLQGLGPQQGKWTAASWRTMGVIGGLVLLGFIGIGILITWIGTDMYRCDNNSGEQAIQACTRVINGRNREPALLARAHAMRGYAKFDINITEALTDFTEAVNLDPTNAWGLYYRGAAKLRIGDQSGNVDKADAKNLKTCREFLREDYCDK
jgi:tetratricopeptide (TPR) repeat protein